VAKTNRTWLYVGILVLGVAGFILTAPPEVEPRSSTRKKPVAKKETAVETFTKEDYDAKFERLNEPVKNSFKPLIVRSSGSNAQGALRPNQVPVLFTDGEGTWFYTGTAVIDQVPTALVENQTTGEATFLKVGQRWKRSTVTRITPTTLSLAGPNGNVLTLELLADPVISDDFTGMTVEPLNPLSGPIGNRPPALRAEGNTNNTREANEKLDAD